MSSTSKRTKMSGRARSRSVGPKVRAKKHRSKSQGPPVKKGARRSKKSFQKNIPKGVGPKNAYDSRVTNSAPQQVYASGITKTINQVIELTSDTMFAVGYSYICAAVQKGWLANAPAPDYPFNAWIYMSGLWINFINGTVPQGTQLPYWMWAFGRAVSAKAVPKGRGGAEIFFKGIGSSGSFPSEALFALGPSAYGFQGNLYVPGTTETDMFPNAIAPGTPTTQEQAFISLCGFMVNPEWPASVMTDSAIRTILDNDVSAFASVVSVTGFGAGGNGGVGFLAGLEVPVHTPMISTLLNETTNGLTGSPSRFANRATEFGGDALFATNACAALLPLKHWGTKISPKFKYIDFMQMGEILSLWLAKMVTQYFVDPSLIASAVGEPHALGVCPITQQEFLLCLRNEIMFAFGPTQTGVQALLPVLPTSGTDVQMTPYLTGATGCALQSFGMLLPLKVVENLRALLIHAIPCQSPGDIELLYPVIGQYKGDTLDPDNYQFSYFFDGTLVQQNVFTATPPLLRRRKTSKGAETWERTTTETPINLIDTDNGTSYVFINDPARLQKLVTYYNDWVSTFASYSDPLLPFSADPGVNVLTSINQTRYWAPATTASEARTHDVIDERVKTRKNLANSVYASRQVYAISYREEPFQVTQSVTTQWLLPVSRIQTGAASPNAALFTKTSSMYQEGFSSSLSSTGDVGMTMADLNDSYASSMVHSKGVQSALVKDLQDLSSKGEAGVLSSIVAGFLGTTFGSTVGSFAKTVADVLPI